MEARAVGPKKRHPWRRPDTCASCTAPSPARGAHSNLAMGSPTFATEDQISGNSNGMKAVFG